MLKTFISIITKNIFLFIQAGIKIIPTNLIELKFYQIFDNSVFSQNLGYLRFVCQTS